MSASVSALFAVTALTVVWAAAWVDFRTFRIPNTLVLLTAALGLLAQLLEGGADGGLQGLFGLALALALLFPLYLLGHMGAGDVKLMGAAGVLLGPVPFLGALVVTLLAAGAIGAAYALTAWKTRGALGPWRRYGGMLRLLFTTGRASYVPPAEGEAMAQRLPVAVPIAIGTSAALLWSSGGGPTLLGL